MNCTQKFCAWVLTMLAAGLATTASLAGDNQSLQKISNLTKPQDQSKKWPPPPKWAEKAKMARYLAHYADWGIISAISPEFGFIPFGTLQSFSDGTMDKSTGIPYFYMAAISDTWKSIKYNNSVSLSVTQAQSDYCVRENLDPEEPICARLTLAGKVLPVTKKEKSFAKEALFTRHPAMKSWPSGHEWDFYKLVPTVVYLLDFYGGASIIPVSDYFSAKP